jgi:hypothetical protein
MKKMILSQEEIDFIKYLRKQKALEEGAASTNSNNGANNSNAAEDKPKQGRHIPDVFVIAKMAMRLFNDTPQEHQTTEGKRYAVDLAISRDKKKRFGDAARFWDAVYEEGLLLDRAADLKQYCEDNNLNFEAVKQHMVLEGKGFMKDIVLNGIRGKEPLIDKFGLPLYIPKIDPQKAPKGAPSETNQEDSNE